MFGTLFSLVLVTTPIYEQPLREYATGTLEYGNIFDLPINQSMAVNLGTNARKTKVGPLNDSKDKDRSRGFQLGISFQLGN